MKKSQITLFLVLLFFGIVALFATTIKNSSTQPVKLEFQLRALVGTPLEIGDTTLEGVNFELYYKIPAGFVQQHGQNSIPVLFSIHFSEKITRMFGTNGTAVSKCFLHPADEDAGFQGPATFSQFTGNLSKDDVETIIASNEPFEVMIQFPDGTVYKQMVNLWQTKAGIKE